MKPLFLLLVFISFQARSQDKRDTLLEHALLWEISGNGLTSPSYMYGTTHHSCKADIVLPNLVIGKLLSSKYFFMETLYWREVMDNGLLLGMKNDKSLSKQLGNYYYKQAKKILGSYYGPIEDDTLETFTIMKLMIHLQQASLKCNVISYDDSLYNIARDNHLQLKELETIEQHHPKKSGIDFLPTPTTARNFISNYKLHISAYKEHLKYYTAHDINWLYQQAAYTPLGDEATHKKEYIDERNKAWIVVMENSMKDAATFFAFGCAHLAGRLGVISLLRGKGYTVTPVY